MMSSLGSDKARGPREKALPAATHTSQPQKQIQATAEQIRLAQMIYDKNDADFEDKVNQLMEVTGKNQDECMVALHDCNEDVSRAINFLLESTSDMTSWETVGKKKPLVKEGPAESKENKENREKKGERESSKGRAAANRKGKGASRSRQARPEENGVEVTPVDRGSDRGRRVKGGKGSGGRGRGRAPAGSRFSAQGMGTFNPADYTSEAGTGTTQTEVWDTVPNNSTDGTVAWRNTLEDWAAEDWSEDVSLSETKVFTSSCAPAAENHITSGQSLDLASLLQKPVAGGREPPSSPSLVFTNSHHHQPPQQQPAPSSTSYAHAALSSFLGAGFGELGQVKRTQPSAGAQILEQLKGPGLGPLPSSQAASPASNQGSNTSIGRLPGLGAPVPPPSSSSWDMKASESSTTSLSSQFSREFGLQPEPSLVLSQLVQRHNSPSLPLAHQPSPPSQQQAPPASASPAPQNTTTPAQAGLVMTVAGAKPPASSAGLDPQGSSTPQQQRAQLKGQKRRIPPTSKIPSTAVEMPGSADIPGLNLQFGALDFGSESEFGVVDNCVSAASRESTAAPAPAPPVSGPGSQSQPSLYSKPLSESLGSPLSVALPLSSSEPVYHSSSVALPSLTSSALGTAGSTNPPSSSSSVSTTSSSVSSSSPFSTVGENYEGTMAPHTRLAFSQNKEATGPVMNGLNGVRTSAVLDTSSTPKPESPSLNISANGAPAPSSHLPSTLPVHNSNTLSSLAQDLSSAGQLNSLNSHVSSHSSVSALGSSSLTHTSVDSSSVSSLPPSSGSYASSQPSSSALHSTHNSSNSSSSISHLANMPNMSSTVGGITGTSGLHSAATAATSAALGLGSNGATATSNLSAPRTTPLLSSSTGKTPPNLSQGVPPLLPNQYIMGPGGLLPAYPQIYGYEDLHMLQSRLPMPSLQDYYGITFPGHTATLSGRDGNLANNPYSGEVAKFGRNDSTSPAPSTSLVAPQPPQGQNQGQSQAQPQPTPAQPQPQAQPQHHNSQQAFLPPGYSYTGLPYYPGVPGAVPSAAAFQYGPTMFVPPGGPGPASAKQHSMSLSLGNPSASPFQQQTQQQPSSYGQHTFSSGYEELTAGPAGVDYSKGYNSSSQAQAKSAAAGPGKGVSVTSSNSGVPDISGSVYNKTQSFDKQGFHAGTPPPFSLPSALGGPGPLNPGAAPGGYAPAPFLHILPHQQPHSQLLHHHLAQDGQGGPSQRGQSSSLQQKSQVNKSSYGGSTYWAN
uniref:UBA domain-containing protein n=1 Tax=Monopterus albus TaxID=43700 RepID=A0A3Q3IH68_MONAL|nr:ubiquitin-associated protein 2 [Monopterus albus]XP_020448734.1 ubiquitin-associated protein 2 [Monopterus albus]XP_020448735.1 ubiquitin-associated protein 2 [Monopterus albus]XP_020448736.1 ubiquitin-associated protein 2 [Monopterus albus]XP_020448737.1 ubiquitin-associated protein 2 [Monopterus albus]XP_020448738.1 ubiquitin-associated protein 2 [Monopterus albus]